MSGVFFFAGAAALFALTLGSIVLTARRRRARDLWIVGELRDVEVFMLKRLHELDPNTRRTLERGDTDPASVATRLSTLVDELNRHERKNEEIANADTIELGGGD